MLEKKLPLIFSFQKHKVIFVVDDKKQKKVRGGCMYETRSKSLLLRVAALYGAALLAITACVQSAWAGEKTVIPSGQAVGIKLFADGVLVVDVTEQANGLKEGDLLLTFNGEKIQSTEHLQEMLQKNGEKPAKLTLRRGTESKTADITPTRGDDGVFRLGAWIRDSMAGIGTVTYYDPDSGSFGALGHGITDVDTQQLMSLGSGSIMETTVKAVKKGQRGDPGELKGDFSVQKDVGTVTVNSDGGIFGTVSDSSFLASAEAVEVAAADEVQTGAAVIRANVSGDEIREYRVEIVKINKDDDTTRNLQLRVTDEQLLKTTGGIVQGMSGSPILQNGKLVGAVTHVMIHDPTRGYGILAENMMTRGG